MRKHALLLWILSLLAALTAMAGAEWNKTGELPAGPSPDHLEITPDGSLIFVSNLGARDPGNVTVVETATGTTTTIEGGRQFANLGMSPDGATVIATDGSKRAIQVIDVATKSITAEIDDGIDEYCDDVAFNADSTKAFVEGETVLYVIDLATLSVESSTTMDVGDLAVTPATAPNGSELLVTAGDLFLLDPDSLAPIATINITGNAAEIAVTPDGALAIIYADDAVSVVDLATRTEVSSIPVNGDGGWDVAVSSDGTTAMVVYWFDIGSGDIEVTVIDVASGTVTQDLIYDPGNWLGLRGVRFHPDTLKAYVTSYFANRIDVLEPEAAGVPDLWIEQNPWLGDDIYNTDGTGQTATRTVGVGKKAVYKARLQNDGDDDTFWIKGPAGDPDWDLRYYKGTKVKASKEITAQVTSEEGWERPGVGPGEKRFFIITVTPASTATGTLEVLVTATSDTDPSQQDAIRADTLIPNVQADLWVKHGGNWLGDDEYNGSGKNQTARQKKAAEETAQYRVRFYNDGDATANCFIRGPAAPEGWTVEYYKGSKDVTDLVTSAKGWKLRQVPPGGLRAFRIEVTPGSGLEPGAVLKVLVQAEPASDPKQRDAVKVVTKVK